MRWEPASTELARKVARISESAYHYFFDRSEGFQLRNESRAAFFSMLLG